MSFQVPQEFYVTVTRKLDPGLDFETARRGVRLLLSWQPVEVDARVIEGAWHLQDQSRLSWWDKLIDRAAQVADCHYLLTDALGASGRRIWQGQSNESIRCFTGSARGVTVLFDPYDSLTLRSSAHPGQDDIEALSAVFGVW